MRVLHFFKTYLPDTTGGIEQVIFQLCQGGRQFDIDSQVLTLSSNPHPAQLKVADHPVQRARQDLYLASTGFSLQVFSLFKKMAAEADIVHFHYPWPMMDLVHFCARHGRPTVLTYHSDIVRQRLLLTLYRPLMRRFLDSMDRIVVASPNYQRTSEVLQAYQDKTVVIPFGLDRKDYPQVSADKTAYWRQRLGEKFFLFVGVLRYYKGLHNALEALKNMDYPLVIIGSGPEEEALKTQARRLELNHVQFLGRLDDEDKACLLQLSHAMVFPSHLRSEAFGISLLEACMYGKPMISCEIGTGTTFVNQHEETGLVIPPGDPVALREAMRRLWEQEDEAHKFGTNAARRFEQMFTARRMCAEMAQLYKEVVEKKGPQKKP
ncbi:glycosyltransferase family 4 protein [Azomonas macrocytogenes]|uniref:Rhamnosyl/mannosyltransferase n=1 Tax=Azomonas macrocytogenes TaxID=69962 RepID=A0A839T0F4_AZOMA|nr:glycosyltransferase family 4 protein [Azomonas macrocytogenes]MBB3102469.1 rhamnosyl/mannosyltransferase [Azomonas macrocytogenes]